MKGINPKFYQHKILLKSNTELVKQSPYRMKWHYAKLIKAKIDKLLNVGFIQPVENPTWISPIIVVPKKNRHIRICINFKRLNSHTISEAYPLPYIDQILDDVVNNIYSFLDG